MAREKSRTNSRTVFLHSSVVEDVVEYSDNLGAVHFVQDYSALKYLEDMILVDISNQDPEVEMPYTDDNAKLLVENSSEFDNWLNEVVFDLENFRSKTKGTPTPKASDVSG